MTKSYSVIVLSLAVACLYGQRYTRIAYIPNGVPQLYMKALDANHDGYVDLVFSGKKLFPGDSIWLVFYSYRPHNRYLLADYLAGWRCFWDIGFIDNDSLPDAVMTSTDLYVYESPAPDSYPKSIVWQQQPNPGRIYFASYITDLDQDGRNEISTRSDSCRIFECVGDNQYTQVWVHEATLCGGPMCWADFDRDGRIEFVISAGGASALSFKVFECTGNDAYQLVFQDTLPYVNYHDAIALDDLDNDGSPEFLVGCKVPSVGNLKGYFWLYEAIRDNKYDIIFHDSLTGFPGQNYWMMSYSGDVDSDGKEELLWAVKNNWMIYKASGNNTFERVYMAYPHPNGNRMEGTYMYACDINGNGYPEIIESREDYVPNMIMETVIWEIEGVRLHRPNGGEVLVPGSQFPITWEKFTPPGADSFSLFVCFDNGRNFRSITTGIPGNDTLLLWDVPDSLSDSCKIMIWAYGPPRAGEDKPRGTAWDFSDTVFAIRQGGIKEAVSRQKLEVTLRILQNPALSKNLGIQYSVPKLSRVKLSIYNTLGQEEIKVVDDNIPTGLYAEVLTHRLKNGIYFITLVIDDKMTSKKVIVIE